MRKFYFLFMAFCLFAGVNAQIINIPDANFKLKLLNGLHWSYRNAPVAYDINGLPMDIDANHDLEIQVSEALNVYKLDLGEAYDGYHHIEDLTGIEKFTNLTHLLLFRNALHNLDVRVLSNLQELNTSENYISNLNVAGLSNLKKLNCYMFTDDNLDLTGLVNLEVLNCSENNNMISLDLSPCQNLKSFTCTSTDLLTDLVINGFNYLENISITSTRLRNLTVTNLPNLKKLYCPGITATNFFTNLQLAGLPNLEELYCNTNKLTSLNLLGMNKLKILECQENRITGNLYLSDKRDLIRLKCHDNLLTGLYVKNGFTWGTYDIFFFDNPNLRYICTEENLISSFRNKISQGGMSNALIEVNSYCSFVPGGLYYTARGNVKYDFNNDGCDIADLQIPNMNLIISNGLTTGTLITNESGNYDVSVKAGSYAISPNIEMPAYFNITPSVLNVSFPSQTSPITQNFCLTANGIHQDLEIALLPLQLARPGFDATYKLIYKNKGTNTQSGTVNLTFKDAVLDLVSANPVVTNQTVNNLSWDFTNLQPFETREIILTLNVNSPTEIPPVNNGDVLNFTATIISVATDEMPNDNTFTLNQTVVGSFDPNDKTCLQGATISPSQVGKYVHYMIRFENTGTYPAQNIVVKDMIDTNKFDINSLVPMKGSHPFVTNITSGNKVEFIFENINLPFDNANNDGYVVFKIKTKPTLVVGNTFSNSASIYFDYNFPIVTNTATTTIQTLSTQDFGFGQYFTLYPNPVKDVLNIGSKQTIAVSSINIYNQLGQLVLVVPNAQNVSKVDVSNLASGNYFIKINSDKGTSNTKFIKQ